MTLAEIKDANLFKSFVGLIAKLSKTFPRREDALAQKNEVEKWAEFIDLYGLFTKRLETLEKSIPDKKFLKPLVVELILQCIGLTESASIEEYLELERCMVEPSDEVRVWCYLYPLDCSANVIDFNGPLRIRRATILERASYLQGRHPTGDIPSFIAETKSGSVQSLVKEYNEENGKLYFHGELLKNPPFGGEFFTLVSVLRLSKPNPIGYISLVFQEKNDSIEYRAEFQVSPWKHPCTLGVVQEHQLSLNEEMIADLVTLWNDYHLAMKSLDPKNSSRLKRALRRYELAICSNEIEDAIVDSFVSLETIFEVKGIMVAPRASKTMGSTKESKNLLFEIVNDARKMRNRIVHGGALEKPNEKVNQYLLSILRQILVCAIVLSKEGEWFADLVRNAMEDTAKMTKIRRTISKWLIK